jgi:hypothetical protein
MYNDKAENGNHYVYVIMYLVTELRYFLKQLVDFSP